MNRAHTAKLTPMRRAWEMAQERRTGTAWPAGRRDLGPSPVEAMAVPAADGQAAAVRGHADMTASAAAVLVI